MAAQYIRPTVDHLVEAEVDYELRLRKQTVDRRESLEDKKRLLRRLFFEDKKHRIVYEGLYKYSDEIRSVAGTVEELVDNMRKKFDRMLLSRLRHYLIRVASASIEDEEEALVKKEACEQIEKVFIELGQPVREESKENKDNLETERKDSDNSTWRNPDPNSAINARDKAEGGENAKNNGAKGEEENKDPKYRSIDPGVFSKTPRRSKCSLENCKCGNCEGTGALKKFSKGVGDQKHTFKDQESNREDREEKYGRESKNYGDYPGQKDGNKSRLRNNNFEEEENEMKYNYERDEVEKKALAERRRFEDSTRIHNEIHRDRVLSPLDNNRFDRVKKETKNMETFAFDSRQWRSDYPQVNRSDRHVKDRIPGRKRESRYERVNSFDEMSSGEEIRRRHIGNKERSQGKRYESQRSRKDHGENRRGDT
ncbi:SRRM2 protein homolog rsr-2-like [Armigeres subalbatus]|uniref:SRRM2 protein homolog rsr-2-like n=1 Tax=Armigeres subalbatus TaxID=124917 RepID=UPI002ED13F3D